MKERKALIVDDEVYITELVAINLEEDFKVICCHDGLEAVEMAVKELPECIIF